MKILNMDIDDLYVQTAPVNVVAPTGERLSLLSLQLGLPIHPNLSNIIYLGGVDGWNIVESGELYESRFLVRQGLDAPTIWDGGQLRNSRLNLLFTGNFSADGRYLTTPSRLRYPNIISMRRVQVIAGGYKPTIDGTSGLNLLLAVPPELHFEVDGVEYSCNGGGKARTSLPHFIDLETVVRSSLSA